MSNSNLCANQVIQFLEAQGVECVFGIPGGHTLSLNDAFIDSSIKFVATRHEYGAASAAAALNSSHSCRSRSKRSDASLATASSAKTITIVVIIISYINM